MHTRLRRYGLVLVMTAVATTLWYLLEPLTRFYFGFVFILITVFASGRYLGYGPSVFALLLGSVPAVGLRLLLTDKGFDDSFGLAFLSYYIMGTIFILLYRTLHQAFFALHKETAERTAIEDVHRANEVRMQGILDNTTALVYLRDLQGRHLLVNRRCEELFKVRIDQIVGRKIHDLLPSAIAECWEANDRAVIATGEPIRVEEIVPQADGLHTYIAVKFPIKDAHGAVVAVGGISTDITDHKQALEALESEQELLRHTLAVQDHERQLLAYEIHDGLVQYAAGASMQLEAVRHEIENESMVERLDQILHILRKTVMEGRRLINEIRTPVLDDCGIVAAVEQLIEEEDPVRVQIEFVKEGELERMPSHVEEALYRITQEALTNIRKHSQSNRVRIQLGRRGDRVHLDVRDWGVGFMPAKGAAKVHGLRGMSERAKIAGGLCTIQSTPGAGTQILVEVPYVTRN